MSTMKSKRPSRFESGKENNATPVVADWKMWTMTSEDSYIKDMFV